MDKSRTFSHLFNTGIHIYSRVLWIMLTRFADSVFNKYIFRQNAAILCKQKSTLYATYGLFM